MKEKRMIRLINDERTLLVVKKALACGSGANDGGCSSSENDMAVCNLYAYDKNCFVDMAACSSGAYDVCAGLYDTSGCSGAGQYDE